MPQRWGLPPGGAVPCLNDVLRAANPQNAVIHDMTIFEVQLPAADEPGETARVRAAELHQAGVAPVGGQLLAGNVEGPIPIHIHVLLGDQHDAMEVERQEADRQIDHGTDRRYEPGDVFHHADQQGGQQVVVRETHRHALLVDMCALGHPLSHALVVFAHRRTGVKGIAGSAHEGNLEESRPGQRPLPYGMTLQIPSSNALYAGAVADLTMPSLIQDIFNASTFHKGVDRTVDGVRVITITYTNGGVDSGPATCDIAIKGKHLPVSVTIAGLQLRLSSWGKVQAVVAPQGAIPISSLPLPPGSGATV